MVVLAGEGHCEVTLVTKLIEDGQLIFSYDDILDNRVIHLRQPIKIAPLINILDINEKITFYRIGDTQNDEFDTSCFGELRRKNIEVIKVCTTPEIEILIIINENLYNDYKKVQNKISPKEYVKIHVKKYSSFDDYINSHDMTNAIREYKRLKKKKGDIYLADLLK